MRTYIHIKIGNDIVQFENYAQYMSFTFKETVFKIMMSSSIYLKPYYHKESLAINKQNLEVIYL